MVRCFAARSLPEFTPNAHYPIRALFQLIWETSLRIGTMWRLEVPKHYKKGDSVLRITADIDKSRYARAVPLSDRATHALDAVAPNNGIIFRHFEYRRGLYKAAKLILDSDHEARHLSAHDFRHAAVTHMAAVGSDLTAIGHVAGHRNATTTALYVHNSEAAARRAVDHRSAILDTKLDTDEGALGGKHLPMPPNHAQSLVGHPGLEPGANGLRTQRRASNRRVFLANLQVGVSENVSTIDHSGHQIGHRDRNRAALLALIYAALDAEIISPKDLVALIELANQE